MLLDPTLIARIGSACWERKDNRYWIRYSRYCRPPSIFLQPGA